VTSLLDVNLLIALFWPAHVAHARAQRWFAQNAHHGWATCAITETGFVRILSNPAVSGAVSPRDALLVLSASLEHPHHHFWTEDIGVMEALAHGGHRLVGHQQVTDTYLLGLAIQKKGRLATFDSGLSSLLPDASAAPARLVLV
jgi:hypothetical protein